MRKTLNALGDRLLGMVAPTVSAKAEPCGTLRTYTCYCNGRSRYTKQCCVNSGSCTVCRLTANNC
ncbi:hypothetical protein [Micromonospora sp. DT31]|uniref:hypothetical protein n=1 Tax=Micromonospora sp. DT31 TaxID=3393434 RepID=UPI003CEC10E1